MKRNFIVFFVVVAILTGCKTRTMNENPFLNERYNTPFEVPPFDKIKAEHYKPAYLKGMEEQKRNVQAIINNPQAPTFENTIKALEYSGELLSKVSRVFGSLNSAHTNDTLQAINKEIAPLLAR
ncbi:MAG: peptidase M3, partial [Bacteroidales bacterium]|nr:peptidase M3 [Bacteroidales bacterium]